ncbi:GAF domain-containing protein [Alkalihalophilus pseudofirmus]|uniref:GAF domain-containing protein n=1 Tax=Alkalihalophilus pseudofirmus TaxID=79885 RepID=A0AAJ2NLG3_ALKPS|nr:STAS domain-containing protein [Alkalihalophilus pseudofirmus]MDV2883953.1 GAF domain-containing protein [Alkalihalophilus pseudofirmus]
MSSEFNLKTTDYTSLQLVSKKLFDIIYKRLHVSTTYIVKKGETAMTVLSSFNENAEIIPEGYSVEYGGTYCRLIISNEQNVMTTVNLEKDQLTRELEVTSQLQMKGFLGVTLFDLNGNVFGTLCVMDKEERHFNEKDISFLQSIAGVLSHLIELDQTKYNMSYLNVPIIPITEGVAILSIQGIIDDRRADKLLQSVLYYASDHKVSHFMIDVGGLIILDHTFPKVILEIVKSLELMGTEAILSGMTPSIARHEMNNKTLLALKIRTVSTLEEGLRHIGFHLQKNEKRSGL